ncbi:MAG TPA: sulfotransferase, partial [Bauldia sp.]|nr:sulfotransferase [Bauldia sp.]
ARHLRQMKDLARDVTLEDARAGANRWLQIGLHYDRVEMFAGGHPKYLEFFAKRVGDRPVAAEVTPSYSLLSADNFREIRAVHPRVKAVYLMRNPIDRAWSALRHRERSGFRIDSRFNRALRAPGLRLRSDYGRTLEALRSAFPAEDLYVEFYERLFTETAIRRLCDFLGIAYHPAPFDRVVNKAKDKVMTADQRQRLGQLLRPVYEYCHQRFGDRLPERWQEDMNFIAQGA